MLKLTDDDTGGNSQALGKLFESRLVARHTFKNWRILPGGTSTLDANSWACRLLFFRAGLVRIVNENTAFTMKDDVSNFVEEGVPELIIALISATQLDQCLIRS